MNLRRLETLRRRLETPTPLVGGWLRESAIRELTALDSSPAVRMLASTLANTDESDLQTSIAKALRQCSRKEAIDAVAEVWQETRHPALAGLLRKQRWLASAPIELRVMTALLTGQHKPFAALGPGAIESLVRATADRDPALAQLAMDWLQRLREPAEIEAFCAVLIRLDQPELRQLALAKRWAPRASADRALFFLLTGQMEKYESLDFDRALLRAKHEAGDDELRRLIAARVRSSGRPELALALQSREKRTTAALTSREWETMVTVLREHRRHDDLWALLFDAPPEWADQILGCLKQTKFRPPREGDRLNLDRLLKLRPPEGKALRLYWPTPICRAVLRRHQLGVRALSFSPDGETLAAVSNDTTTSHWDVRTGRFKQDLAKRLGLAVGAAFSPDRKHFASTNTDNVTRLWDTATWRQRASFPGHTARVSGLCFSPDGRMLATASYDQSVRVWNVASGKCQFVLHGHEAAVLALAFSPDGKTIATGSHDASIRLWSALSGASQAIWKSANLGSVCTLAFAPNGRTLASGSSDGSLRSWIPANGELQTILAAHRGTIMSLAFSTDGMRLATAGLDKTVRLWDPAKQQVKCTLEHPDEVAALAFSPDGKLLATAGRDRAIRIWEVACAKPLAGITREDLTEIQKWIDTLPNAEEARPWHFWTALVKHRFRYDIEIAETAARVLGEFDIELDEDSVDKPARSP